MSYGEEYDFFSNGGSTHAICNLDHDLLSRLSSIHDYYNFMADRIYAAISRDCICVNLCVFTLLFEQSTSHPPLIPFQRQCTVISQVMHNDSSSSASCLFVLSATPSLSLLEMYRSINWHTNECPSLFVRY